MLRRPILVEILQNKAIVAPCDEALYLFLVFLSKKPLCVPCIRYPSVIVETKDFVGTNSLLDVSS